MTSEVSEKAAEVSEELHIPQGINYECTGCGKCCGGWSVPLTSADYERISKVDWGSHLRKFEDMSLYRELKEDEAAGSPYSHAIKVGDDGHCPFLVDNLCFIHSKKDGPFKPSICQLFPYCFNETPSGVFATVSFVSMGVVHNSGRPLMEQRDYLGGKLREFRTMYPDHHPNWSDLKLATGIAMTWEQYLEHEKHLISALQEKELSLEDRFIKASRYLKSAMPSSAASPVPDAAPKEATGVGSLNAIDKHLIAALHRTYFPVVPTGKGDHNFSVPQFVQQLLLSPIMPVQKLRTPTGKHSLDQLLKVAYPERDPEIEDLLYRFFFSRVFGKLYFGAGFGQLSLITGFNHLALVLAVIKLNARALALSRGVMTASYVDVVASVRGAEKRLGETFLGGYAAAVFELLMVSGTRVERILRFDSSN